VRRRHRRRRRRRRCGHPSARTVSGRGGRGRVVGSCRGAAEATQGGSELFLDPRSAASRPTCWSFRGQDEVGQAVWMRVVAWLVAWPLQGRRTHRPVRGSNSARPPAEGFTRLQLPPAAVFSARDAMPASSCPARCLYSLFFSARRSLASGGARFPLPPTFSFPPAPQHPPPFHVSPVRGAWSGPSTRRQVLQRILSASLRDM
jgi:hypothetical protein